MGIDAARACRGHSDADTTPIYAERDKELARSAMERLGWSRKVRKSERPNCHARDRFPAHGKRVDTKRRFPCPNPVIGHGKPAADSLK
jgi:hypothetical protein